MRLAPLPGGEPVKWVATLAHVREVSLLGRADLAFWKDRLAHEELVPAQRDGHAQMLITAADSRFKGIRFREVSFCLLVSLPEDPAHSDAAFLLHAYNSSRFFAFCERAFFSTPYSYAGVRVETSPPCRISVAQGGEEIFRAAMPGESTAIARAALPVADDGWRPARAVSSSPGSTAPRASTRSRMLRIRWRSGRRAALKSCRLWSIPDSASTSGSSATTSPTPGQRPTERRVAGWLGSQRSEPRSERRTNPGVRGQSLGVSGGQTVL